MFGGKKKKKSAASPLGAIVSTLGKQATTPAGLATLRYLAPRLIPVLAPLLLGVFSFGGFVPGCNKGSNAPLAEITQRVRPGAAPEVVANDPNRPNVYQLTSVNKNQPSTPPLVPPTPGLPSSPPISSPTSIPAGGREIVFAFWNCENFFDDKDDHRNGAGDKEYDGWMAHNPAMLRLKLDKLCEAILSMNGGRGPDILAICEVESVRAAQLLQASLNQRLRDPSLQYGHLVMKEMSSGRHIAPAVISRLPINVARTKVIGSRQRIIECHVNYGEKELIVIASHWTSRLQDGERQREAYADKIYGAINAICIANPKADVILCGDLNDNPTDKSIVNGLHATANPSEAMSSKTLRLFNLFGSWTPNSGVGSLYYQGWNMFDQILVSPGMLDGEGWSVDPSSARIVNTLTKPGDANRRPWRFGNEKETGPRGYSDHFPVCVRLIARP